MAASDNRLGEIAQVQLVFGFLYALLLKLDNGADNSTGYSSEYDNYVLDTLMVVVSFAGVGFALIQPVLGHLLGRCGGQGDVEGIGDDVEGIAKYSGSGDTEEVLRETFADIGEPYQVDLDDDVAAGAESNQVDDDIEMGSSVPEARPEAREAEVLLLIALILIEEFARHQFRRHSCLFRVVHHLQGRVRRSNRRDRSSCSHILCM